MFIPYRKFQRYFTPSDYFVHSNENCYETLEYLQIMGNIILINVTNMLLREI
jgi:hypothetical protein